MTDADHPTTPFTVRANVSFPQQSETNANVRYARSGAGTAQDAGFYARRAAAGGDDFMPHCPECNEPSRFAGLTFGSDDQPMGDQR
jgi:hypothetical protein